MLVVTFGVFALGETMYGPVLNPLIASLAPSGYVGTTLGLFAGLQTGVSALGPLVAGAALGAGLADGFVALHVLISAVAVLAAWRLQRGPAAARPAVLPPGPDGTDGSTLAPEVGVAR